MVLSKSTANSTNLPQIINLHEDPMLSECVVYAFHKTGITKIGRSDADAKQDIELSGLNIKKEHAVVEVAGAAVGNNEADSEVTITPVDHAKVFVNGDLVTTATRLKEVL